ncbi:DUF6336 family protein [Streptomyces broussonetiae]|uniref:DUF6336 family protein n=1 Tax=Streptomyces broussonetiae TaxID=2686304 RepID=A0ABV5EDT0_9ACTN
MARPVGETDGDGVRMPHLRLAEVLGRGAAYGLAASLTLLLSAPLLPPDDRPDHLSAISFLALTLGLTLLAEGAFPWWCCLGDIRRFRDWRTLTGQTSGVTAIAPACLRLAALTLPLSPTALLLTHLTNG